MALGFQLRKLSAGWKSRSLGVCSEFQHVESAHVQARPAEVVGFGSDRNITALRAERSDNQQVCTGSRGRNLAKCLESVQNLGMQTTGRRSREGRISPKAYPPTDAEESKRC